MIRIVIADHHAIFRAGLKEIISRTGDMQIVGEAVNGEQLLDLLQRQPSDIVVQNMRMPGLHGVELIHEIRRLHPHLHVVVLSMFRDRKLVGQAVRAGASGYVTKASTTEILVAAIRKIHRGGKFIDPALVDEVVFDPAQEESRPHEKLSQREADVLQKMLQGQGTGEIANALSISAKTVSTYKMRILQKLELPNMVELIRYALEHGLI